MKESRTATTLMPSEGLAPWGPDALHERNEQNRRHQAKNAASRNSWIRRNKYYYGQLRRLLEHLIEPDKSVLNINCETGFLLNAARPSDGVGVDISPEMLEAAQASNPRFVYHESFPEEYEADRKFDYIILNNIGDVADVQKCVSRLHAATDRHTRLLVYKYNHLWQPAVSLAERLGLKTPSLEQNWLSEQDLMGILTLAGFEWLRTYRIVLLPKFVPLLSWFANRFLARLPGLDRLCMVEILVARPKARRVDPASVKVSVIIPCKDERGNIEAAVERIPDFGNRTEIVFCDDKSTDGTADEVRRMQTARPDRDIKLVNGPGICKSQNVWTGFAHATGDILVILDADLTVMPEELPYFIEAMTDSGVEFVNGSRLVYPVPKAAMKGANLVGNKLFSMVFSYLLRQTVKDTLCGTKALWRSDWERIKPMLGTWGIMDRWGDYELLFGAAKLNLRIVDQPIHYQERIYGATKMTKVFKNGLIMLRMCLHGLARLRLGY
jgi:SAM-dependent methyltransferase